MDASSHAILLALNRFFILSYREEARRQNPRFHRLMPLSRGIHVDLVIINGGQRAHLFYRSSGGDEDVVEVHDVTMQGPHRLPGDERRLLEIQLNTKANVLHLRLMRPYEQQFEEVAEQAQAFVRAHKDAHSKTA